MITLRVRDGTLAAGIVASTRSIGIEVVLGHGGTSAAVLASRMVAACRTAGLTAAATAGEQAQQEPVPSIDALVARLDRERVAFVAVDVHHAMDEAPRVSGHRNSRFIVSEVRD